MTILWDKKLIRLSDGSYIAWGLKRKKFFFANKNELKLNCAIIEYYEEREKCDKKVISDLNKMIAELEKENVIKPEKVIELPIKGKVNVTLNKKNKRGFEITKEEELKNENAELKEVHERDKRSLALIAKKYADFEKANEWHYVKDGDLPKEKKDILMSEHLILLTKMKGTAYLNIALGNYNFSTQEFSYQHIVGLTDVIAWREIVLPKELENDQKN